MKRLVTVAAMLGILGASYAAWAAKCEGVSYPDKKTIGGQELVLNGLGIREATMLQVDVYVAALYLPQKARKGKDAIAQAGPKHLELTFVRDVEKKDIAGAWTEGFKKNAKGNLGALKARVSKINGWMADMKAGQKLIFSYVPEKGIEVTVNGKVKGTIEGEDFMKVFFAIWLGPNPPNPGLGVGLLGGHCG